MSPYEKIFTYNQSPPKAGFLIMVFPCCPQIQKICKTIDLFNQHFDFFKKKIYQSWLLECWFWIFVFIRSVYKIGFDSLYIFPTRRFGIPTVRNRVVFPDINIQLVTMVHRLPLDSNHEVARLPGSRRYHRWSLAMSASTVAVPGRAPGVRRVQSLIYPYPIHWLGLRRTMV